jgi:hypothetical protein
MSTPLEGIIRPFSDQSVEPSGYTKPGQGSAPMVRLQIGFVGEVKALGWSMSATTTFKMGQAHHEVPPNQSAALQTALQQAAGG